MKRNVNFVCSVCPLYLKLQMTHLFRLFFVCVVVQQKVLPFFTFNIIMYAIANGSSISIVFYYYYYDYSKSRKMNKVELTTIIQKSIPKLAKIRYIFNIYHFYIHNIPNSNNHIFDLFILKFLFANRFSFIHIFSSSRQCLANFVQKSTKNTRDTSFF